MAKIDWDEYKEYKRYSAKSDNFEILLEFIKSYYNTNNPTEIYHMLKEDEVATMMLNKRSISEPEDLENFLFKI